MTVERGGGDRTEIRVLLRQFEETLKHLAAYREALVRERSQLP